MDRGEVKVEEHLRKVHISNRVIGSKPLALETWVQPQVTGAQTQRNAESSERISLRSSQSQADIPEKAKICEIKRPHRPVEPRPAVAFRRPSQKHTPKTQSVEDQKTQICICNQ